ncbi:MAG: transposase, partial [Acidobacteriaceae bacterium]|nr:transposase [Acidobacteriaceae bacterium]
MEKWSKPDPDRAAESGEGGGGTEQGERKQPKRSKAERQRVVEETLKPGTSVSQVARAHGVNANQVFAWRKLYREGRLNEEAENALLPVKVAGASLDVAVNVRPQRGRRAVGIIDIDL